jgi:hypothetical protein
MKGKLIKVDDKWYVEYTGVSYSGGNPKVLGSYSKKMEKKTLPLLMDSTTFPKDRSNFVIGSSVKFTQVLVNPMGREVDPNDLSQNQSGCVWYGKIVNDKKDLGYTTKAGIEVSDEMVRTTMIPKEYFGKEEQKQHLIDMMRGDEELGLYDDILTLKLTKEDARGLLTCIMRTSAKGKDLDVGEMVEEQLVQFLKLK